MIVISFLIEIFRRSNAEITAFYAQNIVHAVLSIAKIPITREFDHSLILAKNDRTFLPDEDISTFKRPNYCILRTKHSARLTKRQNKPDNSRNSIIRLF
jgi:hypothetical protein